MVAGLAAQGAFAGMEEAGDWRAYADRILAIVQPDKARD
jgi:hypothetical protein